MTIKACLLDLAGTLHLGDELLPGAAQAVARLREAGLPLLFVSNTSRQTRDALVARLSRAGLALPPEEVFTAPLAGRRLLEARGLRPLLLVHPELLPEFEGLERDAPNAVFLADAGEHFRYASLNAAFRLLLEGAPFIATGLNRYFREGEALSLDAGPFVRALEYAAGVEATVVGKPAPAFFRTALETLGVPPGQAAMIGDDAVSDVNGALAAGLAGILVRTGKYRAGDEEKLGGGARVADDIGSAVSALLETA